MQFLLIVLIVFTTGLLKAEGPQFQNYFFNSKGHDRLKSSFIRDVKHGSIIIVGEKHGFNPHHLNQNFVINTLQREGFTVSVGIEHIDYTRQRTLNKYMRGDLSKSQFMKSLGWRQGKYDSCYRYTVDGGYLDPFAVLPYDCYDRQIRSTLGTRGRTRAINLPRSITGKVAQKGMQSLTQEERDKLPPNFEKGRAIYYERFKEWILSGGHGKIDKVTLERMFIAQSLWDDTMAWQTLKFMQQNPRHVFVIIVGDFHAAFGGGLKDRLLARGAESVIVISQLATFNASNREINDLVKPDPEYGDRADYIYLTNVEDKSIPSAALQPQFLTLLKEFQ